MHQAADVPLALPNQPLERFWEIDRVASIRLREGASGLFRVEAHGHEPIDGDVDGVADLGPCRNDESGDEVLGGVEVGRGAGVGGGWDGGERRRVGPVELFNDGGELGHGSVLGRRQGLEARIVALGADFGCMALTTPAGGYYVVEWRFGGRRRGVVDLLFWRRNGRGWMALRHSFLVDAGDGFFEEGRTGNGGRCPGGVATRPCVGKVGRCG